MNAWIIFYGDGTTFPEIDASGDVQHVRPENICKLDNVQAIATEDAIRAPDPYTVGRVVIDSWDFYIYSDKSGGWHGTNRTLDLIDHLQQGCGPGGVRAVLTGRWIPNKDYRKIIERARTEGNFHNKSSETKYPSGGLETE